MPSHKLLSFSNLLPNFLSRKRSFVFEDKATMPCLGEKPKDYHCKILLLDDSEISLDVKSTSKGQVVLDKIFDHLNLVERDYFGVRFLDSANQTHWLDTSKPIGAQLKNCLIHTLYFGVKFYAADPCKLNEEITRYQFFQQVKRDMLQGRLPVVFDTAAELSALAVQSELGDFDPKRHTWGYASEFRFVPNQSEELEVRVMHLHRSLVGQVPAVAEYRFLDKVKWLEMYGVDLHPVQGEGNVEYFVGLTPTGIVVYRNKSKVGNYFWPRITKVTFKAKQFMVRVKDKNSDENTYTFECNTKAACKHLWKCCIEHHAFFRLSQANDSINNMGRVFSMGSKYRYSGRTERQAQTDMQNRQPPQVVRMPSRRHQRRASVESRPQGFQEVQVPHSLVGPVPGMQHSEPSRAQSASNIPKSYNNTADSPRSTRSAPWESGHHRKGGLYTSGRESPLSVRSEKMLFPSSHRRGANSGSESEGGQRKRSNRFESDNESEMSRRHRRRRNRGADSGSESESSYRHRTRHSRKSNENLPHTEQQWKDVQRRVRDGYKGRHDSFGKELRPNGSLNSMPGSEASHHSHNRRRRRRSRSPGNRPPEELAQHFRYVEPGPGMTEEQMRDIPFTNVETKVPAPRVKHSPHARHRQKSPRRRSYGENNENRDSTKMMPHEEPPPPYSALTGQPGSMNERNSRSYPSLNNQSNVYRNPHEEGSTLKSPMHVYRNEAHVAPVVKTKPVPSYPGSQQNMYVTGSMDRVPDQHNADRIPDQPHHTQMNHSQGSSHARDDSGLGIDPHEAPSSFDGYHAMAAPPGSHAYMTYLATVRQHQYLHPLDPHSRVGMPPARGIAPDAGMPASQPHHPHKPTHKHMYIEQGLSERTPPPRAYPPNSQNNHYQNTPPSYTPRRQPDMMTEL